ncbi:DUF1275 family protein [Brevundimonas vesicularis]|uniref:DUF1275 family protein n=1 Tax=Brevundimonas vesicularis TaxID=41276 RepID=UPI00384F11F7
MLACAALAAAFGLTSLAILLMVAAMGAENSVFLRNGEVGVSLTYMTGALVKLGQALAAAATGRDRTTYRPYLALWAGLTAGAVLGALTYQWLGLAALWPAAGLALMLSVIARFSRAA